MTKADKIFYENIKRLLSDEAMTDESGQVRPHYEDGIPAHTRYITQVFETYDISKGEFPITTLRPILFKKAIAEIFWIYQDQSTDLDLLATKHGVTWWDSWDIGDRTIGNTYGAIVKQYDLINRLIKNIKENPFSRYHIISLWQEENFTHKHGLKPCAFQTLWTVRGKYLDCTLVQRSSDYLVAGHINMMQYVALQMMIAKATGYEAGKFSRLTQNLHIYDRHIEQAEELVRRYEEKEEKHLEEEYKVFREIIGEEPPKKSFSDIFDAIKKSRLSEKQPKLIFNPKSDNFYDFTIEDFEMVDYEPMRPQLRFELGI